MARPRNENPTPAELEVLRILWNRGPSTVREVHSELERIGKERAYTSVMSLLNVMFDKGYVDRESEGRAFRYAAATTADTTLGDLVGELRDRAFDGSASTLVTHLLQDSKPSSRELDEIRRVIEEFEQRSRGESR